ncbi:OmpA family protein [Dongia mobilis]|uniref:OmpA family protein n=1 Tax=Dongia mobilis TaxID=578943 RepID=A0A4R6WPQ8_9PROT|nr:OmpA family protein [Dongia mobilis]TDQ83174.1 OmpA family protein [Dongia mobilis]
MIDFAESALSRGYAAGKVARRLALRSGTALRGVAAHPVRRAMAVAAIVAVAGCSGDVQRPSAQASAQASGQASGQAAAQSAEKSAGDAAGTAAGAAAASSGASPDINSVPTTIPQPQDVSIDGVQPGLVADRANAQYTDETLTAPEQSVARPAAPVAPTQGAAAQTAPVQAGAVPAPQAPAVIQQPLPGAGGQIQAPQMAASGLPAGGQTFQGYAGTPQPGSKPFGGGAAYAPGTQAAYSSVPTAGGQVMVDYSSVASGGTYGYASYGGYLRQNPAQAYYRSPYGAAPAGYGLQPAVPGVTPGVVPGAYGYQPMGFQPYAPPVAVPPLPPAGQPVGIVYFNNGSARLSRDDNRVIQQVAEMQRYYGGVIRIVGHASQRTGNMDYFRQGEVNYKVSADRANSVARAFTKAGVPGHLVQVAAAGAVNPVSLETMPAGEANNRRVEIFLSAY